MNNFIISEQLANSIFSYLSTKPYSEVSSFIEQLKSLKLVNIVPPVTKVEPDTKGDDQNVQSNEAERQETTSS